MRKHTRPGRGTQKLLLIFAATVVTPCLVLGFLAARALTQERRIAEQQVRERLEGVAESTGRKLELELKEWQQRGDDVARTGMTSVASWPAEVRAAFDSGAGVVLLGGGDRWRVWPDRQLSYELTPLPDIRDPLVPMLEQAESLELRDKTYDAAIAAYRQLLVTATGRGRAGILHRLARTLKKSGNTEEAARVYRLLEAEPPIRIGSLPSDLIALFELSSLEKDPERSADALRLYRGLVESKWQLEKSSYAFYAEEIRPWIPASGETTELARREKQKLALSAAAEDFIEKPRSLLFKDGSPVLASWRTEPFAAILLAEPFLTRLLPTASDLQFSLQTPDGRTLASDSATQQAPIAMYTLQDANVPLRLTVWPRDTAGLYAAARRQQNFYFGVLAIVVAVLGFGGYFTLHTVKTELAVAQEKSDFVSNVSHEFRSPLAGINQLGEMLRDGRVNDEARRHDYYEMIVTETQRLRRMVENILDFSRMEDNGKQYRLEPLEPAPWLREVATEFQAEIARAGFALDSRIPDELPAIVGDRETLTTAVHNLLDNAVKYSRDCRTVRLEVGANAGGLAISVCDRGVGIREEDRSRIFERFYRGGGDIAREVKGVGLGLNLVQHIVKAHGGAIDVESKVGEGSTFTIHLKTARNDT